MRSANAVELHRKSGGAKPRDLRFSRAANYGAILAQLALGESSVNQLAEPFDISPPAISRHLKVLENARLITRGRDAQWRPCKLNPEQLKSVDDWLNDYRRFWEESFDRLDDYLQKLKANKKQPKEKPHVRNRLRKR